MRRLQKFKNGGQRLSITVEPNECGRAQCAGKHCRQFAKREATGSELAIEMPNKSLESSPVWDQHKRPGHGDRKLSLVIVEFHPGKGSGVFGGEVNLDGQRHVSLRRRSVDYHRIGNDALPAMAFEFPFREELCFPRLFAEPQSQVIDRGCVETS